MASGSESASALSSVMGADDQGEGIYASTSVSCDKDQELDQGLTLSPKIHSTDLWRYSATDLIDDDVFEGLLGSPQPDLMWERHQSSTDLTADATPLLSDLVQECQRLARHGSGSLEDVSCRAQSIATDTSWSDRSLDLRGAAWEPVTKRPENDIHQVPHDPNKCDAWTAPAQLSPGTTLSTHNQQKPRPLNDQSNEVSDPINDERILAAKSPQAKKSPIENVTTGDETPFEYSARTPDPLLLSVEEDDSYICLDWQSGTTGDVDFDSGLSLPSTSQSRRESSGIVCTSVVHQHSNSDLPRVAECTRSSKISAEHVNQADEDHICDFFRGHEDDSDMRIPSDTSDRPAEIPGSFSDVLSFGLNNAKRIVERKALEDINHIMCQARLSTTDGNINLLECNKSSSMLPSIVVQYFQDLFGNDIDETAILELLVRVSGDLDLGAIFRDKEERKILENIKDLPAARTLIMIERTIATLKESILRSRVRALEDQMAKLVSPAKSSKPPSGFSYLICTRPAQRTNIRCNTVNQSRSKRKGKSVGDKGRWEKRQYCTRCRCRLTEKYIEVVDHETGAKLEKEQAKDLRMERSNKKKEAMERVEAEMQGVLFTVDVGQNQGLDRDQESPLSPAAPQMRVIPLNWFNPRGP